MTRMTNARVAGFTFLFYIAVGITAMVVSGKAMQGPDLASKLTSISQHASQVQLAAMLNLLTCFCALVLGVTLYALTRDEDPDLAMLGLTCRVAEGVVGGVAIQGSLGLVWLATAAEAQAQSQDSVRAISAFFLWGQGWSPTIAGAFFGVGSALFSWLLLRGRMIPSALAWLGVLASVVVVVGLLLKLGGVDVSGLIWLPMAAFEIPLALWLLIKGVATQRPPARV